MDSSPKEQRERFEALLERLGTASDAEIDCALAGRDSIDLSEQDHDMSNIIEANVVINRPVETVFDYVTDVDSATRWQADLVEVKSVSHFVSHSTPC